MDKKAFLDIITLLVIHYFGNFLFHTKKMADRKSKNVYWLLTHVLVYILYLFIGCIQIFGFNKFLILYVLINGVLHFVTDSITSKLMDKFKSEGNMNMFYKIIGIEQSIQLITLITSYQVIIKLISIII